jgi:hypothetical protein
MRVRLAPLLLAAGCAHSHWNEQSKELCRGEVCYRVGKLSEGWQIAHKEHSAIGFYHAGIGAVIGADATCRDDAEAAPLSALTNRLLGGYTERKIDAQETVPLAGREALRTRLTAKLDGVPMALDLLVLKRNGCVFDLSYAAPPDRYRAGLPDFERFVGGFVDERRE